MSDWIDDMKSADDAAASKKGRDAETRLHCARVIRANAPAFWQALVERLQADCARLNETFPNDRSRRCTFSLDRQERFKLEGHGEERKTLRLTLNLDGLGIAEEFFSGSENRTTDRRMLSFKVDENERLFLTGLGGNITDPEIASEMLIKRVIGT